MTFAYIGPQIEELLGWEQNTWVGVQDWVERMHEEDRDRVVNFCVSQSQAGVDHEADYRALTKDGRFVWIRDVVHVVRKSNGEVDCLIGFMFDISERKQTEQKLVELQKELEHLSFKDGLTGLANRRKFDLSMEIEWRNAKRTGKPLSLIMVDIDYFKQYNDHYGHLQGDDCLKLVSKALAESASRARDFAARFGGEEFVLLLPESNTDAVAAVAERCREAVSKLQIPHAQSSIGEYLSISLGVGTIVPGPHDQLLDFINKVDRRLYTAKQQGRNCIVIA
jgi:diguanylate cyclase (GGDEF)-like protein/PAS domain S-box-containing protein